MSSVTSNFFDDKTPEYIINWMLDKLTEEQIKTCLDQAGIPNTDAIRRPEEPVSPKPTFVPGSPGGSGSGSGSDPAPPVTMELDRMRRMCENRLVLIEDVSGGSVSYYEFGPDEGGDLKWGFKQTISIQNFISNICNEEKKSGADEILDLDIEEKKELAPGLVINDQVPPAVKQLASDYYILGLPQPLLVELLNPVEVSDPSTTIVYDREISDTIKIQLDLEKFLADKYGDMYAAGMTKFPIFVFKVDDKKKIFYISLTLRDDNTFGFLEKVAGPALFIPKIKKELKELMIKVTAAELTGWSKPIDYAQEIDTALNNWSSINSENRDTYDKILVNYNPARLAEIKQSSISSFGEMIYKENYSDEPEMNTYFSGVKPSPVRPDPSYKNARDLDIDELNDRMITLFGKEYAETHEPVITYNKFGVRTVQYRKRTGPRPILDAKKWTREDVPVFDEFGTGSENFDLF